MELHQGDLGAGPYGELCLQGVDTIHTHGPRRHTPSEVEIEASSRAPPSNRRTLLCARSLPPPPLCMCACACVCVSPSLCVSVPLVSFSYPSRLLGKIPPPPSLSLSLSHTHTLRVTRSLSLSLLCVCVCVCCRQSAHTRPSCAASISSTAKQQPWASKRSGQWRTLLLPCRSRSACQTHRVGHCTFVGSMIGSARYLLIA